MAGPRLSVIGGTECIADVVPSVITRRNKGVYDGCQVPARAAPRVLARRAESLSEFG
jgi:hypothetical protein